MKTLALLAGALTASAGQITAVRDVNIIDVASGKSAPRMTVIVEDGVIARIGPADSTPIPQTARIVAGKDKFLIPGLWDMDVHIVHKEYLPLFAAYGITGVEDMGSDFAKLGRWRAQIESGEAIGPRIVTCGPPVDGEPSGDANLPVLVARNGDEARQAFDRLYKMNVDFIGVLSNLPRDAYFALAELARHWDLRLVGRVPSTVTAQEAVEARQKSLRYLSGVTKAVSTDQEALAFFSRCALTGTRISPALVFWQRLAHFDDPRLMNNPSLNALPEAIRNTWPDISADPMSMKRQIWRIYRLTALAAQAKAEILAGTGAGDPYVMPGEALQDELEQLVEAGLTPRQALEAATLAPVRFLELDRKLGNIERGKQADMVLLDKDPVLDIRNVRTVRGVFLKGRYLSRPELDGLVHPN